MNKHSTDLTFGMTVDPDGARNVLGRPLQTCSLSPLTGYFRDGCCNTDEKDQG